MCFLICPIYYYDPGIYSWPLNTEKSTAGYEVCYQGACFSAKEERLPSEMSVLVDLKLLETVWSQASFSQRLPNSSQVLLQSKRLLVAWVSLRETAQKFQVESSRRRNLNTKSLQGASSSANQ